MKSHPKVVTAFTFADDDRWLPPGFVVGNLVIRHVATLDYDQYFVDGSLVDGTTVTPLANATHELVRLLKEKSSKWARHDRLLAKRRARKDDSFREESVDEDFGVQLVRDDASEAFGAFCQEMRSENQRLMAERRAEVAELVRKHWRSAR